MPRLVGLHIRLGPEGRERLFALLLGQAAEIELVVVAQEGRPLRF